MTVRFKIMLAAIGVILVANALLSIVGVSYLGRVWFDEVQDRVRLDLNSARAAYDGHIADIRLFLSASTISDTIPSAVEQEDWRVLDARLDEIGRRGQIDFLCLLSPDGKVVRRLGSDRKGGDDIADNPLVAKALSSRKTASGTIVLTAEQLARENPELATRARFELLETVAAVPTDETYRSDGLVVAAAVPVCDHLGEVVAILYGGNLLNRRYEIVDAIKDEVFPGETYENKDVGTVTIFQHDLRVATNVTNDDGERAVGTRLSKAVYDVVLRAGDTYAAPAFVVNDWYITAYEPIRDPNGRIVGALYVGLLQAPFVRQRNTIAGGFLALVLVTSVACLAALFFISKLVLHPIERIVDMSHKVIEGDLSARVGIRPPGEMGTLCRAVDEMADAVAHREEELKQATRQHIGRTEKLASMGRLAAGVAHEINNPLTGVLTFAHLLRDKENMDDQDQEDLELIIRETSRAAEIVRGLLDFSRERPANTEPLDINEVIQRTVQLIRNQKLFDKIYIREEFTNDLPPVEGDANQLQQVLLNLALNACESMHEGGELTLRTRTENGRVLVEVKDTGCGIEPEYVDRLFEPFFSTKPVGKGTGLGLSVSYGIVRQHGGAIDVASEPGNGSTFTIVLPAEGSDPLPEETAGRRVSDPLGW